MTEEEKKAIEITKTIIEFAGDSYIPKENRNALQTLLNLIDNQQKETEKYKRYFKLAISDLQSEGYMQMPFKNIENYYSKREDIV